jgi:hypothetical protein
MEAIAQVDLGSRGHKHQASHDLAVMAAELLARRRPVKARPTRIAASSLCHDGVPRYWVPSPSARQRELYLSR